MKRRFRSGDDFPLGGVRILVTRPREDVQSLQADLESLGAEVLCLPTIAIQSTTDTPDVAAALERLDEYDWMAFTSRNSVRTVFHWLQAHDQLPIPATKIAAVGAGTATELQRWGVSSDCVPMEARSETLGAELIAVGMAGVRLLLPLGDLAGNDLSRVLTAAGATVTVIRVYQTAPAQRADSEALGALVHGEIDVATFASPSAFNNLLKMIGSELSPVLQRVHLVALGPTTAQAVLRAGFQLSAVATRHTADGLVQAIVSLYTTEQA